MIFGGLDPPLIECDYAERIGTSARDYTGWAMRVPWLAAVFFVGGAGRAFSWLAVGAPHPFFLLLMMIELALPPLLVLLWWRARPAFRPAFRP